MDDKDYKQLKKELVAAVKTEMQANFNGKMDRMQKKLDDHMEEVQPFLDGWNGAKTFSNFLKYLAGFIITIGAVVAVLINLAK